MSENKENLHLGHRKRKRDKFLETCSLEGMPENNILEFLLFYAIPRADTNELAHRLLREFGSLKGVFDAPVESLMNIDGVGEKTASLLKLIPSLVKIYLEESASDIKSILTTEDAVNYLRPKFTSLNKEALIMLCLNNTGKILKCSVISKGSIIAAEIDVRKIISEVINTNATSVIIAHNHPGGICAPSKADRNMTYRLARLLGSVHAKLLNHIIMTDSDYFSFADHPKFADCFIYSNMMPSLTVEPISYDEYQVGEDDEW